MHLKNIQLILVNNEGLTHQGAHRIKKITWSGSLCSTTSFNSCHLTETNMKQKLWSKRWSDKNCYDIGF